MNAVAEEKVLLAPRERLAPCPFQPRKHFDPAKLAELAESIKAQGILQPLLVRERPGIAAGHYEIIAGERRWRAAQLAGLDVLPVCLVERDDAHALEGMLVENLQRDDLLPLEEARAYKALIEMGKHTVHTLAQRVGRSVRHVYACIQMLRRPMKLAKALENGELPAAHAQEIAQLPTPEMQDAAYRVCFVKATLVAEKAQQDGEIATRGPIPLKDLRKYIARQLYRSLLDAPWKLDDATLSPKAGACAGCAFNTGCEKFEADLFDRGDAKQPTCRKGECYDEKLDRHIKRQVSAAKAAGEPVVPLSSEPTYSGDLKSLPRDQPVPANLYEEVKPSAKDAVKGIVMDGPAKGKEVTVKLPEDVARAKGVLKASEPAKIKPAPKAKATPADEARKLAERRRAFILDRLLAELEVPAECWPDFIKRHPKDWQHRLIALAVAIGQSDASSTLEAYEQFVTKAPSRVGEMLWEEVCERLVVRYRERFNLGVDLRPLAALLGLAWKDLEAEAAREIPGPPPAAAILTTDIKGTKLKKGEGSRPAKRGKRKKK